MPDEGAENGGFNRFALSPTNKTKESRELILPITPCIDFQFIKYFAFIDNHFFFVQGIRQHEEIRKAQRDNVMR